MSEMKSAWEKAMEKVEKLGKPSEEELKQLEYVPIGNKLAAQYLQGENFQLDAELTKYKGTGVRKYVIQGAEEIFLRNIALPQNEKTKQNTRKAMTGIKLLKENQNKLDPIFDRINNLLNYYEQALQQTYMQFRKGFESKLQEATQGLQQQLGNQVRINPEQHPQFHQEWHNVLSQLNAQYEKVLEEHRQEVHKIA